MNNWKEMFLAMGFEHEQYTGNYSHEPDRIVTTHILTHPSIPGLFLNANSWEGLAKRIVPSINVLHKANLQLKLGNLQDE